MTSPNFDPSGRLPSYWMVRSSSGRYCRCSPSMISSSRITRIMPGRTALSGLAIAITISQFGYPISNCCRDLTTVGAAILREMAMIGLSSEGFVISANRYLNQWFCGRGVPGELIISPQPDQDLLGIGKAVRPDSHAGVRVWHACFKQRLAEDRFDDDSPAWGFYFSVEKKDPILLDFLLGADRYLGLPVAVRKT